MRFVFISASSNMFKHTDGESVVLVLHRVYVTFKCLLQCTASTRLANSLTLVCSVLFVVVCTPSHHWLTRKGTLASESMSIHPSSPLFDLHTANFANCLLRVVRCSLCV